MSEEKQIEEMAKAICSACAIRENCKLEDVCRATLQESEALYNAGYRKQSEGEWIIKKGGYYQRLICSACGHLSIGTFDFCPNCGAKMRKEDEGK